MPNCGCNFPFLFPEYHWPHCPNNPENLKGSAKAVIESKFTKAELASIAKHGPMRDEPVRKLRGVGSRKPSNAKAKR